MCFIQSYSVRVSLIEGVPMSDRSATQTPWFIGNYVCSSLSAFHVCILKKKSKGGSWIQILLSKARQIQSQAPYARALEFFLNLVSSSSCSAPGGLSHKNGYTPYALATWTSISGGTFIQPKQKSVWIPFMPCSIRAPLARHSTKKKS